MAAAITATKTAVSFSSSKFGLGAGNHESAKPALPEATSALATGVRNPISSEAPLAIAIRPMLQITSV